MNRRQFLRKAGYLGLGVYGALALKCNPQKQKPNILFIAVDDLRPELHSYGVDRIHSPHIDRLAAEGVQFNRAFCNIPVCGASRASLLTGTRPTWERYKTYYTRVDIENPDDPTLPEYFRKHGYYTVSNSKVFHHEGDAKGSWDEEWHPESSSNSWRDYILPENIKLDGSGKKRGPAWEMADVPDSAYKDGKTAIKAINDLERLKDLDQPFFLACGFLKPHLPFNAPKKYWDLYDRDSIPGAEFTQKPDHAPDQAMHNSGELRHYSGIPESGPVPDETAKRLKHGYYACVSYTDAQIGKLLNALNEFGLTDNTIVILWGDHGWNLREHGMWCKHCNFETSLHAPLIIKAPGIKGGVQAYGITEFIYIYPSLCELAGLDKPAHLEGQSFVPLLKREKKQIKNYAVCRWKNGITFIKNDYFYTEWIDKNGELQTRMLYNHELDPFETVNVSTEPENQELVQSLSSELRERWGENFWTDFPFKAYSH